MGPTHPPPQKKKQNSRPFFIRAYEKPIGLVSFLIRPAPYFKPLHFQWGRRKGTLVANGDGGGGEPRLTTRPPFQRNRGAKVRTSDPAFRRWKVVGCPHANHAPGGKMVGKKSQGGHTTNVTMLLG